VFLVPAIAKGCAASNHCHRPTMVGLHSFGWTIAFIGDGRRRSGYVGGLRRRDFNTGVCATFRSAVAARIVPTCAFQAATLDRRRGQTCIHAARFASRVPHRPRAPLYPNLAPAVAPSAAVLPAFWSLFIGQIRLAFIRAAHRSQGPFQARLLLVRACQARQMVSVPAFPNCDDRENCGAHRCEQHNLSQGLCKHGAEYKISQNTRHQEQAPPYSHSLKKGQQSFFRLACLPPGRPCSKPQEQRPRFNDRTPASRARGPAVWT
jgi:hypothetical protein